jgi:hypothetical protein
MIDIGSVGSTTPRGCDSEHRESLRFASVDQRSLGLGDLIYGSRASYLMQDIEIGSRLD